MAVMSAGTSSGQEPMVRTRGWIALGGAVVTFAGSFLTWFESGGESYSGWKLYDMRNDAGEFPFMIDKMFHDTFDPFFTGGATVLLGLVLGALAVAVLTTATRPLPSRLRVHPALYAGMVPVLLAVIFLVAANGRSILQAPEGLDISVGPWMWLTMLAAVTSIVASLSAAARRPNEMIAPAAAPPPAAAAPVAPGWYADPAHRHQVRYWDGTTWSTHVADAGAASEDPVGAGR